MLSAFEESRRTLCSSMLTFGFICSSLAFATSALLFPMSCSEYRTCLWRLLFSMTSKSTMPILPTPAAARYMADGVPSPPAPTTRTLAALSAF